MEFFLSMSILSSAADVSREKGKVQEWIRAWVAREDGKGSAAAEQGEPPRRRQSEPRAQEARGSQGKKPQGRPWFAPEFDGLHCFETIVSH